MSQSIDTQNITTIVFDWDGTVVDSVPYKLAQNQAIAHEFGNDLTTDQVRHEWNESAGFPDLMHRLTGSDNMDEIMRVVERDYNNPDYAKRKFGFAQTALESLKLQGYNLAVVTNATRQILETDAEDLDINLEEIFDYTQAVDESEFKKPHPRTFERLVGYFGIQASQLLYVGDEIKDYMTTVSSSTSFLGVTTGMMTSSEFEAKSIPYARNISQLAHDISR